MRLFKLSFLLCLSVVLISDDAFAERRKSFIDQATQSQVDSKKKNNFKSSARNNKKDSSSSNKKKFKDNGKLRIGDKVPNFSIPSTDGDKYNISNLRGNIVVLEWFAHDCPFVEKQYKSGVVQGLQSEFADKGIVWMTIMSIPEGGISNSTALAAVQQAGGKPQAVLLDVGGDVAKMYGATHTPTIYIVDQDGKLSYRGGLGIYKKEKSNNGNKGKSNNSKGNNNKAKNNKPEEKKTAERSEKKKKEVSEAEKQRRAEAKETRSFVKNAVDELLGNKTVTIPNSDVKGCLIKGLAL